MQQLTVALGVGVHSVCPSSLWCLLYEKMLIYVSNNCVVGYCAQFLRASTSHWYIWVRRSHHPAAPPTACWGCCCLRLIRAFHIPSQQVSGGQPGSRESVSHSYKFSKNPFYFYCRIVSLNLYCSCIFYCIVLRQCFIEGGKKKSYT